MLPLALGLPQKVVTCSIARAQPLRFTEVA
jgi:hypothetical protein